MGKRRSISLDRLFTPAPAANDLWPPYEDVVARARRRPPSLPEATAHSFAQWVYHLYNDPHPDRDLEKKEREKMSMYLGKLGEAYIGRFRSWLNRSFPSSISGGWRLRYLAREDNKNEIFHASRLQVGDQALRCRPDVVLKHESTGDIIVIELKVTGVPLPKIPPQGWQNLRAQLWCYSWIDEWASAENIYLIGQFWRETRSKALDPFTLLPVHPRWRHRDRDLEQQCSDLFRLYGGTFTDSSNRT